MPYPSVAQEELILFQSGLTFDEMLDRCEEVREDGKDPARAASEAA